jgi:hypothetical protein
MAATAERTGIIVRWRIDGEGSLGYFQKWALPVPGDRVVMYPDEADEFVVEVVRRIMEQPERDLPRIVIVAERVVQPDG